MFVFRLGHFDQRLYVRVLNPQLNRELEKIVAADMGTVVETLPQASGVLGTFPVLYVVSFSCQNVRRSGTCPVDELYPAYIALPESLGRALGAHIVR